MAGRASRREAERLIVQGRVRVNGVVVSELGARVVPGEDRVSVDGDAVAHDPEPRWVAFHKPPGCLTTREDPHGGRTVYDLLPPEFAALRYVGRLDRDTEGLLIFSNRGDEIHGLLHPGTEVEREYRAWVAGTPSNRAVERLVAGVTLGDGPARAKRARLVGGDDEGALVELVLTEGRKREVRRLLDAVGHPVRRLMRVRFGPVELGDLPRGAWRPLHDDEIDSLVAMARGS